MNDVEKLKSILIWLKKFELPISPILQFSIEDKIEELQAAGVGCDEDPAEEQIISDEADTESNSTYNEKIEIEDFDSDEDETTEELAITDSSVANTSKSAEVKIDNTESCEYKIYGPMLYRDGNLVYRTSGKIIALNDRFYRLYYTYNGFTVSAIESTKAGTFTTGKTLIFAARNTPLHTIIRGGSYDRQVEEIKENAREYKIRVDGEWFLSDGSSETEYTDKTLENSKRENIIESFVPAGKIKYIYDNLSSSYDHLCMMAIIDLLREVDSDSKLSYDEIACMMIANAWEMACHIPEIKEKENRLMECVQFLIANAQNEIGKPLDWDTPKHEVYEAIKEFPMYDVFEDVADEITQAAPYNILKTWYDDDPQFIVVEKSQAWESNNIFAIFPRKYDPHIVIKPGWKKYFSQKNAELLRYFAEKYLVFIGAPEDAFASLDHFMPQSFPADAGEEGEVNSLQGQPTVPNITNTPELGTSQLAFTPISRATMRARKKADEAETRKKTEAAPSTSSGQAPRMDCWGTTEEFTVITDEIIDAALTPRGGITRSQLEAVGLSWPKPLDWREQILGMKLSPEELRQFMTIKYAK